MQSAPSRTVLVLGSGGREHALSLALAASPSVGQVFVGPGNGGTTSLPGLDISDPAAVIAAARLLAADLVVIGPEAPLAAGMVDALEDAGIRAFGPTRAAARLEASKAFAKAFMARHDIPTARWGAFTTPEAAHAWVEAQPFPVVVKASGLAAGKGVILPEGAAETHAAIDAMFAGQFGDAGAEVVIEERLTGPEISVLAFCDGTRHALMPAAQDHKRVFDNDTGPNTGGMGAFAPTPLATPARLAAADAIVSTVLAGMAAEGAPFRGILYVGLICPPDGPRVLEFNVRFGDPETQVILPLVDSDLAEIFEQCIDGRLAPAAVRWREGAAATVVAAAPGYPGAYPKGLAIDRLPDLPDVTVHHAGTQRIADGWATAGGRVLAITGTGRDLAAALDRAYAGMASTHFDGMHFRQDIGNAHITLRSPEPGISYRDAGVNIDAANAAVERIKSAVRATHTPAVLGELGAFGGLFSASAFSDLADPVLVASTDGVGTKTMIAAGLGRFDTIGVDLVNHCVNDVLVQGARPLFFLDYIASSRLDPDRIVDVVTGCARACEAIGCALLGGETAEMPGVYRPGELDLVGTLVGVVDREALIDGRRIADGDVVLALPSSGLHTNGYSLARRIIADAGLDLTRMGPDLLAPHRCYLPEVEALWEAEVDLRGLVHVTGGGLVENPPRIIADDLAFALDLSTFERPAIFRALQDAGRIAEDEMRRAFNCGVGMLVVVPESQAQSALDVVPDAWPIGRIIPRDESAVVFA